MAATRKRPRAPKFQSTPHAGVAPETAGGGAPSVSPQPEQAEVEVDVVASPERMKEALRGIIDRLQRQADEQVRLKAHIEQRWIDNLRRYNGRYDRDTEARLQGKKNKSKLFANVTRPKTVAWEARLSDLLFPTDDKNWGIEPTPVPELADAAKQATQAAKKAAAVATDLHQSGRPEEAQQLAQAGNDAAKHVEALEGEMDEARRRSELMQAEIEDQLEECQYNIRCRDVIHDICKLGTGIMKGPVAERPRRRAWQKVQDGSAGSAAVYRLGTVEDNRPSYHRTDPWNFFPNMSVTRIEDSEFTYERHLCTKKDLRKLGKAVGFDPRAAARLLAEGPRQAMPTYVAELREITQTMQPVNEGRYHVWEYRGILEREDIETIAAAVDIDISDFVDENPFEEIDVVLWFCQGELLKIGPGPLDSCEPIYSVCVFERDDASMFGFGVPDLACDSQSAKNSAWRMMLDNAALSVGPQIVVDKEAITPADGEWDLKSMKVWLTSTTSLTKLPEGYKPFQTFDIPSRQDALLNIIEIADRFLDEETFMPRVAEGDQGTHIQTAQGMSMLMNSANVVFRRVVKNFDDMMTTPNIRRLYDWNMQFSPRSDIKGDYEVKARGSSVLIVRELQLQNLNQIIAGLSGNPIIGPMMKWPPIVRKLMQASHISADETVKTDDVIKAEADARERAQAEMQKGAGKASGKSPEEIALMKQLAQEANATKLQIAELQRETTLMALAQKSNMTLEELRTKLQMQRQDHQHKERVTAAEAAIPSPQHIGGAEF